MGTALRLNRNAFSDSSSKTAWEAAGIKFPSFDREAMIQATKQTPRWLHFGTGNIFRAFIARMQGRLLDEGHTDTGIIAASAYDYEVFEKVYKPYDNLSVSVGLRPDGGMTMELVGSVAEAMRADQGRERLKEIARAPSLQIISFCITEKGYALANMKGELFDHIKRDMESGPDKAGHTMTLAAALLWERFKASGGKAPLALLSLDNCSRNGDKLKNSVLTVARAWVDNGFAEKEFISYIEDAKKVSFPWTMIDKITPRPSEAVRDRLKEKGVEGMDLILTAKGTYVAPFVNAEIPEYVVIEDDFPAGRPPLEKAGAYFAGRETVEKVERMKVTTCLNPLHTALAVFGCLLGYKTIASEMKAPLLKALVERIGYVEGMPVVTDPGIFSPKDFIREVLEERFPNPFIPDTPQRIATDTSQKIPIRFGETIKSYMKRSDLSLDDMTGIPLVIAGWFRYLLALGDDLEPMELSGDPMLEELKKGLAGITVGSPETYRGQLRPFLSNAALFGADLCSAGLAGKIESLFTEMLAGKGAVAATLGKYLNDAAKGV